MGRHTTSTSPMRSKAVLGALPIAASVVTLSAGSFAGTALASDSHDQGHHESQGVSKQVGEQTGKLAQQSASSAPASQSAPSTGLSIVDLGDLGGDEKRDHAKGDHAKGHAGDQRVDDHANNAADAVSGNSAGVKQQLEQGSLGQGKGKSVQGARQAGELGQSSKADAPASQFAPSTGISVVSFGGDQQVDNHANNSAKATSGNSGGIDQQLLQKASSGKRGSVQSGSQDAGLSQGSAASAPASQFAPSTAISVLSFGGDQKVDNHANNSAKATSGNSGGIDQQQKQG